VCFPVGLLLCLLCVQRVAALSGEVLHKGEMLRLATLECL
jgi:hypothetical protein